MSSDQERFISSVMRAAAVYVVVIAFTGCWQHGARSERSFDEIHHLIADSNAPEVVQLLGEPDSRQPIFGADEKWVWWNYTFLDGSKYPPELRGRVVHLEVLRSKPPRSATGQWRVSGRLAVNYRVPLSSG